MPNPQNLKPFVKNDPRRINKPKGSKHVSTWVNELLNDENFTVKNFEFSGKDYKGAPLKAITITAIHQALAGDVQWAKWLTDNATKLTDQSNVPTNTTINFINVVGRSNTQLPTQSTPEQISPE